MEYGFDLFADDCPGSRIRSLVCKRKYRGNGTRTARPVHIKGETETKEGTPKLSVNTEEPRTNPAKRANIKTVGECDEDSTKNTLTQLDVSKGSIQIKATGAGLVKAETSLNPKGYYITGTTTANTIVVDPGVTIDLTFENVSITNQNRAENCVTVSHANVTITLIGNNTLSCGKSNYGALVKDGMDNTSLTIQCEYAGERGHKCTEDTCGILNVKGTVSHATAIGNMLLNRDVKDETGFCNLTIKGGIINAQAGAHNSAIGAGCNSYVVAKGYTKKYFNIRGRYHCYWRTTLRMKVDIILIRLFP